MNGQPKVGELLEQAWTITEKCRFKILKNGKRDKEDEMTAEDQQSSEYGEPSDISNSKAIITCLRSLTSCVYYDQNSSPLAK